MCSAFPEAVISASEETDALAIASDAAACDRCIYHVWLGRSWHVQPATLPRPMMTQHKHALGPAGPAVMSDESRAALLWHWREALQADLTDRGMVYDNVLLREQLALANRVAPRVRPAQPKINVELTAWGCLHVTGRYLTSTGRHLARRTAEVL